MTARKIDIGKDQPPMIGWDDFNEGVRAAIANGMYICMPRVKNVGGQNPGARATKVKCPHCGEDCWRDKRIPQEAKVACTNCALRLGAK